MPTTLVLDCWEDELSETQIRLQEKTASELKEFQRKISDVYDMVGGTPNVTTQPIATTTGQIVLQNVQQPQVNGNYLNYVVEPNNQIKLVVQSIPSVTQSGQMVTSNATVRLPVNTTPTISQGDFNNRAVELASRSNVTAVSSGTARRLLYKATPRPIPPQNMIRCPSPVIRTIRTTTPQPVKQPALQKISPPELKVPGPKLPPWKRPVKKRISNTDVIDLTADDFTGDESSHIGGILPTNDNPINDEPEKTFPSLVVVARTFLSTKNITAAEENSARTALDAKVKRVLVLNATALTEFLIHQKMIRGKQFCRTHEAESKLGMYSDASRLPNSGGYVWVSECCPSLVTSVFSGSIFEGAPHPPSLILKLIYHWACQTSVQNVLHWVKVSNVFVKKMYTFLRSICVAVVHQHFPLLGGPGQVVEVGLISLGTGTTSGDNICKHVKVEVLGIYDQTKRWIRLRALDPIPDTDKFKRKKFIRCLEPLRQYIHSGSIIVTDICADDPAWQDCGFMNVEQSKPNGLTNKNVMNYIRNIVPRMFQNTLSLLSRQLIQQFFDELVWRETWGWVPFKAYNRIMSDIIEVTQLESGTTLIKALCKIAVNPFKNWRYQNWPANCSNAPDVKERPAVISNVVQPPDASMFLEVTQDETQASEVEPFQQSSAEGRGGNVYLESYYYGSFEGEVLSRSSPLYTECAICMKDFRDNAQFADHLIMHALNENYPRCDVIRDICRLCLKIPDGSMNAHVNIYHKNQLNRTCFCKICNISLGTQSSLIKHMTGLHNELELPYTCDICYFRTSIFEDMQNHFSTAHKNLCCAQCPFCHKVVNFVNALGEDIFKNQLYFIKHIQRHQLPFAKRCSRCALSFTNMEILWDHQEKKHMSCRTFQGITRWKMTSNDGILMPEPKQVITFKVGERNVFKTYNQLGIWKERIFEDSYKHPVFNENLSFFLCHECDGPSSAKHFTLDPLKCVRCTFSTHCHYALGEHMLVVHSGEENPLTLKFKWYEKNNICQPITHKPYFCVYCSFYSTNGNEMARHLSTTCNSSYCTMDKRKTMVNSIAYSPSDVTSKKRRRRKPPALTHKKRRKTLSVNTDESADDDSVYSQTSEISEPNVANESGDSDE